MKKYLEDFHRMKLFRLKDVVQIVGNEKSAKDLLHNYKKQQLIYRIRRNLYTITDLATKQAIATKFEIGSNITPSAYVSHHSALEYHGLAHQQFISFTFLLHKNLLHLISKVSIIFIANR
jgi:predicted transcriptional regulator of viral defense system